MARLPSEHYLIQHIGDSVILFEDGSEEQVVKFNPTNPDSVAKAQKVIYDSDLTDEDKCFAHMWSGYFYAHATSGLDAVGTFSVGDPDEPPQQFDTREEYNGER